MDTLLQIGLGNALVATFLAVLVAGICRTCRRPALVHTLWLLVLLKLVTPSPLPLPVTLPAAVTPAPITLDGIEDRRSKIEDRESNCSKLQSSILNLQSSIPRK